MLETFEQGGSAKRTKDLCLHKILKNGSRIPGPEIGMREDFLLYHRIILGNTDTI